MDEYPPQPAIDQALYVFNEDGQLDQYAVKEEEPQVDVALVEFYPDKPQISILSSGPDNGKAYRVHPVARPPPAIEHRPKTQHQTHHHEGRYTK